MGEAGRDGSQPGTATRGVTPEAESGARGGAVVAMGTSIPVPGRAGRWA